MTTALVIAIIVCLVVAAPLAYHDLREAAFKREAHKHLRRDIAAWDRLAAEDRKKIAS